MNGSRSQPSTSRRSAIIRLLALSALLIACGPDRRAGGRDAGGLGDEDAAAGDDGGLGDEDAAAGDDVGMPGSCVTDVPCVGELQCVALPGTACNLALAEPRCQRVRCGSVGSPCSSAGLCVADSPCLGDVCRTADEAQDRCLRSCLSVEVVELGSYEPCSAEQVRQGCERACEGYPLSGWWAAECPLAAQGPEYWGGFINVLYCDAARGVCQADVNCSNIMHPPLGGCG